MGGAWTRWPSSVQRFARVCAAPRGVRVLKWDVCVVTGERDKRDAKSKGNATHDVTHEWNAEGVGLARRSSYREWALGGDDDISRSGIKAVGKAH